MDILIDDLLNYSRLGHKAVHDEEVSLQPLVEEIVRSFAKRIAEISARVCVPNNLPIVRGDQTLISQILINLLDNALTYHRKGIQPQVTLNCTLEKELTGRASSVIISVKDNGIGIPPNHFDKIFNIFQRLHSEDEYSGTGIGLAIVKKSIELMDGQVWVESKVDEGTTFFVKIPQ